MTETQATIRCEASKFEKLLIQSALQNPGSDPAWVHSDVYLRVDGDSVETIIQSGGGSVLTYCTFDADFFEEVEGETEAILSVEPTLDRLAIAADGGRTRFEFIAPENSRLAEGLEAEGALEMRVSLPASEKVLQKVPEELPERWDDDERFLSPSGNPHKTFIDTTTEQVCNVIEAVELDGGDYFPITVEAGDLTLNVGDENEYLRGDLHGDVDGPDLQNWYGPGFEAVFQHTLPGSVQLQTTAGENGGNPVAVVKETTDYTIRHVLVEVNPA